MKPNKQRNWKRGVRGVNKTTGALLKAAMGFSALTILTHPAATCGVTLADWTFETSLPATSGPFSPETGGGSAITHHGGSSTYSHPAGNGSAASFSSTNWVTGDYYQFQTSTINGTSNGYDDITISFDQTSSATGPGSFQLEYSTDDSTFTNFGSVINPLINATGTSPTHAAWSAGTNQPVYTFSDDLSSITALANQSTIYFRLVDTSATSANGGTVASGGTDRVDNVIISGTSDPLPAASSLTWTGGDAAWDQTNARFQATAANDTVWSNTNNGTQTTAVFNTPSSVTIDSGGISAKALNFQTGSNGVSLAGPAALTLGSTSSNVSADSGVTATIGAKLTGSAGLSLAPSAAGTVVLTNNANDFTGNVTLGGGTLSVSNDGQLGDASNSVIFQGGTLQLTTPTIEGRTLNVAPGGGTLDTQGNAVTLNTPLTGSGTLTLIGGSRVTLGASSSPFTGALSVSSGTLVVNSISTDGTNGTGVGTSGTGAQVVVGNGGTLSLENGITVGNTFNPNATTPAFPITLVPGVTGGTLAGTGGMVIINGASATGATSIGTGTGQVTLSAPLATDTLVINSALRNSPAGSTFSSSTINVAGAGVVQIASGGTSQSNGPNPSQFTGVWAVNSTGILLFGTNQAVAGHLNSLSSQDSGSGGEQLNAPGYIPPPVLTDTGTGMTDNPGADFSGTTNPITLNTGTIAFGADAPNFINTTTTGANSFRSPLTLNGGSIASTGFEYGSIVTAGGGLGGGIKYMTFSTTPVTANLAANITLGTGATVDVDLFDPTPGNTADARSLNIWTDPNYRAVTNDNNLTFTSSTKTEAQLTATILGNLKWGTNSTLVVTNGSDGATGGSLNFARSGGTVTVNSGATMQIQAGTTVNVGQYIAAETFDGSATYIPGGAVTVEANAIDPFTDSTATGTDTTHSIAVTAAGTLNYAARTGANGDTGLKLYRLGALSIPTGGQVMLQNAASQSDSTQLAVDSLNGNGSVTLGFNNLTINNGATFTGSIGGTGGSVTVAGGTVSLTGNNSYTGGTNITGGTMQFGAGADNSLSTSGPIAVGGGTLDLGGRSQTTTGTVSLTGGGIQNGTVVQNGGNFDMQAGAVSAALDGTAGLSKTTSGTVTLTGANHFGGPTSVTGGTLLVNGSIDDTSAVAVSGSGTLGGSGFVGAVTVSAGGTEAPGNSPGNLHQGDTIWTGADNYNWQLLDATGAAGTGYDLLSIDGTLDLTGASGFDINLWSLSSILPDVNGNAQDWNPTIPQTWTLATTTEGILGFDPADFNILTTAHNGTAGFSNPLGGGTFSLSTSEGDLLLNFTPGVTSPEPTSLVLLGLGTVLITARRRRA